jgi:hypothetical protein
MFMLSDIIRRSTLSFTRLGLKNLTEKHSSLPCIVDYGKKDLEQRSLFVLPDGLMVHQSVFEDEMSVNNAALAARILANNLYLPHQGHML